jgi:hypothetical protein
LPAGKEEETQIIDGDLFDFDLEVKPVLEVLVGRSVIQAQYELIEEYERDEYLKHKKRYEKKREFELNKLQRIEAKYVRKEEEKQRRFKQKEQRKINDIISQKKLMANVYAKSLLKNLKKNSLIQLQQQGFLASHSTYNVSFYVQKNYIPDTEETNENVEFIEDNLENLIEKEIDDELKEQHENSVKREKDRIYQIAYQKAIDQRNADKAEKQRRKEQLERREKRRINRITESIMNNIVSTKADRKDIMTLPLNDIDELSTRGESIQCLGGQIGEIMFTLDEVLNEIEQNEELKEKLDEKILNDENESKSDLPVSVEEEEKKDEENKVNEENKEEENKVEEEKKDEENKVEEEEVVENNE